mmetsp:Transcript_40685/g.122516  ORF Transcript_40685/g.122516 Transcript_40685/m.122516 type:complete len:255 (-) Transcript_40685:167-931(-)
MGSQRRGTSTRERAGGTAFSIARRNNKRQIQSAVTSSAASDLSPFRLPLEHAVPKPHAAVPAGSRGRNVHESHRNEPLLPVPLRFSTGVNPLLARLELFVLLPHLRRHGRALWEVMPLPIPDGLVDHLDRLGVRHGPLDTPRRSAVDAPQPDGPHLDAILAPPRVAGAHVVRRGDEQLHLTPEEAVRRGQEEAIARVRQRPLPSRRGRSRPRTSPSRSLSGGIFIRIRHPANAGSAAVRWRLRACDEARGRGGG